MHLNLSNYIYVIRTSYTLLPVVEQNTDTGQMFQWYHKRQRNGTICMYGIYIYIWNVYHYGILAPQGWTIEPIFITSQQSVKLVKRHLVDFPFDGTYIHAYTVYCEIVTSGRIEMLFYIFSRSPHRVWLILTGIGGVVERNSHVQRWGYHNSF